MDLIIDFDNTIVESDKAIWELYRKDTGDLSTDYKDHSVWWYDDVCPLWSRDQQDNAFQNPEFFEILEFMPNAVKYLQKLKQDGHTITVCTVHRGDGVPLKVKWIRENLSFIDNLVIVESSSVGHKSMICGDIILDDSVSNLSTTRCDNAVCFGKGKWNQQWTGQRAKSWEAFYRYVQEVNQEKQSVEGVRS
jgi:5'(3')-deoxyribonucleotidase